MHSFVEAAPRAGALIESLRAVGYSLPTAVADLIDNSIAANATRVDVQAEWAGASSRILVTDDGLGMSRSVLVEAMRLGSRAPSAKRSPNDLGRFGLGLKTASFSQCRRLTVFSRTADDEVSGLQWDIDHVIQTNDWQLKEIGEQHELKPQFLPGQSSGTVVCWEQLDRIVGLAAEEDEQAERRFLAGLRDLEQHLSMIFHRFLASTKQFSIYLNGNAIEPWDPFLSNDPATQRLGEELLPCGGEQVAVKPFVLPHHSKLTVADHGRAGGAGGWNAQQGFYVYRNGRLLVPGSWLGLGMKKEEHYKLARLQVDIPVDLDMDWQLDVRKSTARPPGQLREELKRIAIVTRRAAAEVYRHRGRVVVDGFTQGHVLLWQRVVHRGKVAYRLNRNHPLVSSVLRHAPEASKELDALLRFVEETIPVPTITIESAERPDDQVGPFELAKKSEIVDVMQLIWTELRTSGLSPEAARERLYSMEPFIRMPDAIGSFEAELDSED